MSFIQRFFEKQKDPEGFKSKVFLQKVERLGFPRIPLPDKAEYHFKHSGNVGDIIYSIPVVKAIAGDCPVHLHLQVDRKVSYGKNIHPLGNVMLNEKMVSMLKPLILSQPGFATCDRWNGEPIDIDLDDIRKYPFLLNRGSIARWYFLIFGKYFDLHDSWLSVVPDNHFADAIVIARSQRYHAPGIRYNFFDKYPKIYFTGTEEEFAEMKKEIPDLQYRPVNDFLELARIIAGSRLFIGNQSFPYSLSEAMKINRLLEWYFQTPNVVVEGDNGFDFCFQDNFCQLVADRYMAGVNRNL